MPIFRKKILSPDRYTLNGQETDITTSDLRKWVRNFNRMRKNGYSIPAPFRHDESAQPVRIADVKDFDSYNNGGWWNKVWVSKNDGSLWGTIDVPDEEKADKLRRQEIKEVSPAVARKKFKTGDGKEYENAITHIALVTHPIAANQESFEESISAALCFSRCDAEGYEEDESGWEFQAVAQVVQPESTPTKATGATLQDAIEILQKLGLQLPSDTTEENFLERVVTAGLALVGSSHGAVQEQPVPPVSMSQEDQMMSDEQKDKDAKPELTPEQSAALNFAQKTAAASYKQRIQSLVNDGKVTAKMATEKLQPLLQGMQLTFSAEGDPVAGTLDTILDCLEANPKGSCLVTKQDIQRHGDLFSLNVEEEQIPDGLMDETADRYMERHELNVDEILDNDVFKARMA